MRLLLRFANREGVDTITLHQELLLSARSVWWGWFKKAHEPFPLSELLELAQATPVTVGLVNRDESAFYEATCEELVVADREGVAIPTPDESLTPRYYADAYLPAWFRFSALRTVDDETFTRNYGGIPEGDPTLFLVTPAEDGARVESTLPDSTPSPHPPRGESIFHVSDLHFGEFHGFPMQSRPGDRPLATILTDFLASRHDITIAALVASGDFTSKGDANHFAEAEKFVNELATAAGLDLAYVVVVPGNHDIWLQETENFDRDYRVEHPYRMFVRSLFGANITEIEGIKSVTTTTGWEITFLALNSARARSTAFKEYGYVGHDRYSPWLDRLEQANRGLKSPELVAARRLNIAVLHHHLLPAGLVSRPAEPRPVSLTLDAGAIVADLQDASVHLALHGHEHLPLIATTGRVRRAGSGWKGPEHDLLVLGSGSTGASVAQLSPEERMNTFSLYTPLDTTLRVEVFAFNSAIGPEVLMSFELPL